MERKINNVSLFYEVNEWFSRDAAFVKLFKGWLVNIIDCRRVSTRPGTVSAYPGAEAISCLYDRRLKNVFLTKVAPFLFDSFNKEIDVAAVKSRSLGAGEPFIDDDELDDEAIAEWLRRDHFNERLDVGVVANDGFPLFLRRRTKDTRRKDAWAFFLANLQVDESFLSNASRARCLRRAPARLPDHSLKNPCRMSVSNPPFAVEPVVFMEFTKACSQPNDHTTCSFQNQFAATTERLTFP